MIAIDAIGHPVVGEDSLNRLLIFLICIALLFAIHFFSEKTAAEADYYVSVSFTKVCGNEERVMSTFFIDDLGKASMIVALTYTREMEDCATEVSVAENLEDPEVYTFAQGIIGRTEEGHPISDITIELPESQPNSFTPTSYVLTFDTREKLKPIPNAAFAFRLQYSQFHIRDSNSLEKHINIAEKWLNWSTPLLSSADSIYSEVIVEPFWLNQYRNPVIVTFSALLGSLLSVLISETSLKAFIKEFARRWRRSKYYGTGRDPE